MLHLFGFYDMETLEVGAGVWAQERLNQGWLNPADTYIYIYIFIVSCYIKRDTYIHVCIYYDII